VDDQQITHGTFTIEKRYPHAPEKVFDAFRDPVKKRRWMGGENDPHSVLASIMVTTLKSPALR
jgi:uncharacterized protein YndB with AHSA1/START domain